MTQLARSFGDLVLFGALAMLFPIGFVLIAWTRQKRRGRISYLAFLPYLGRALAACAVVLVLAVTLTPAAGMEGRDLDLMPFRSIAETLRNPVDWRVPLAQLGGNMLLFAAVGFLVPVGWGRFGNWRWIGLIALGLGAGIEAGQYLLAFGRVTATDDVILAVAGALFGLGALRILEATRLKPLAPGPLSQSSAELVSI